MRTIAISLLVLAASTGWAQPWSPATVNQLLTSLDASAAKYEAYEHYEARSSVLLFARPGDSQPSERGESRVWKVGAKAKAEHLGIVSYQNERLRVTIDRDDRVMVLAEPENYVGLLGLEERRTILGMTRSIEHQADDTGERFRVRFPEGSEYDLVTFSFDKNGWLRRLETQWGTHVPLIPDNPITDMILPRVVMEFELPRRIAATAVKADPAEAVAFVAGKPQPTNAFAGFRIIDNRLRP